MNEAVTSVIRKERGTFFEVGEVVNILKKYRCLIRTMLRLR